MKHNIYERKKVSSKTVLLCDKYVDKSNNSNYPDLTSDSGEDSDESDVDSDSDCEKQTQRRVDQMFNPIYESKKSSKMNTSERKSALQHKRMILLQRKMIHP